MLKKKENHTERFPLFEHNRNYKVDIIDEKDQE